MEVDRWFVWYGHPQLDGTGYVWSRYKVVCPTREYAESISNKPSWFQKFLAGGGVVRVLPEGQPPERFGLCG